MDDASADLILRLQIQDIQRLQQEQKGKQRAGVMTNTEQVLTLQREEMELALSVLQDRRFCRSIATDVGLDAALLDSMDAEETQAHEDRRLAQRFSSRTGPAAAPYQSALKPLTDECLDRFSSLNAASDDSGEVSGCTRRVGMLIRYLIGSVLGYADADAGEGSYRYFNMRARDENTRQEECIVCAESKPYLETVPLACQHIYCQDCLRKLFDDATIDETLYPPRCCRAPINPETVRGILGPDLCNKFEAKAVEWETSNRVYCPIPTCSTFIPPPVGTNHVAKTSCPVCTQEVCTACKREWHGGEPCKGDDEMLLQLTNAAGFQRCACGHVVELTIGCNHMTCRCRREFCYRCAAPWKTCTCVLWDEERLYGRAREVAARANAVGGNFAIRQVMEQLRE